MIIPVLALQDDIYSNFNPFSLGIALGAYGFTQGILQIPFGIMSDKFGRKRLIYLGLVLFTIGSIVAATAVSMEQLILGRAIQGSGAISGTLLAIIGRHDRREKSVVSNGASWNVYWCCFFTRYDSWSIDH